MKKFKYPPKESWDELCKRPALPSAGLDTVVREILGRVKSDGDKALSYYSEKFDGFTVSGLEVPVSEIEESEKYISDSLKDAINIARVNILKFHSSQVIKEPVTETTRGVKCWRKSVPIDSVGLYIPGGNAPLFSTLLMLGIPAKLAGCKEIIVCTPAGKNGKINDAILYAAKVTGISRIFRTGGAQAIAAMAYGTESIPSVLKIFGPGNQYVTRAKELVQQEGVAIDMPAGPSEVLVLADSTADPGFIAADLLSQAEHGPDSQVLLATDDYGILTKVEAAVNDQVMNLPTAITAQKSLAHCKLILLDSPEACIEFSNHYAPEHLILNMANASGTAEKITNAGSVFIGKYSCESAGDYASGTNHTLPTNGYARNYSGVSTESFVKKITFQEVDREGLLNLGPSIETMAKAESLYGHSNAVSVRLKSIKND